MTEHLQIHDDQGNLVVDFKGCTADVKGILRNYHPAFFAAVVNKIPVGARIRGHSFTRKTGAQRRPRYSYWLYRGVTLLQ